MKDLDITPKTLVGDMLTAYPELEERLIKIAPVFKKLKNPVLRRTIAKVTTLKQASIVGKVSLSHLINELRTAVNQSEMDIQEEKTTFNPQPEWVEIYNIKTEYDAGVDLKNDLHPAGKATKEILTLGENEQYLLITPFIPAPLVKIIEEKNFETYTWRESAERFYTHIRKKNKGILLFNQSPLKL